MNTIMPCVAALLLLALCGCFKVKEELAIHPDGSGMVRIETEEAADAGVLRGNLHFPGLGESGERAVFPPTSLTEARVLFPEPDFQVSASEEEAPGGGKRTVVTAAFKDVNALLSSRYGKEHQLSLKAGNGRLVFKARTGLENAIRCATMQLDKELRALAGPEMMEARKKTNEMRAEFRLVLPGAAASPAGMAAGNAVNWVFEHSRCTNSEEYAMRLEGLLEASCSDEGLRFSPATPARLGLAPFNDLAEGGSGVAALAVDAPTVLAAARFVPYALTVARFISLGGRGGSEDNLAVLTGAVVVPKEFEPLRWGLARLSEAVDATGKSLLPEEDRQRGGPRGSPPSGRAVPDDQEAPEDGAKRTAPAEARQGVRLEFRAPEWSVKAIARIRGVQPLQYPGPSQVVKLAGIVAEKMIVDLTLRGSRSFGFGGPNPGVINNERLRAAGLDLRVTKATVYYGMTTVGLAVKGRRSLLLDAQVFDADGRPWPTACQRRDTGEGEGCDLVVVGRPRGPLSLAVLASSQDTIVEAPLVLDHVAVDAN